MMKAPLCSALYPFAALVAQAPLKLALLLCAIAPRIGGVLLRGEKGTAKSTAARGLSALLPRAGRFRTLPLGATEDRLAGGLDLERTLADGRPIFQPGLLSEVHQGLLYVDEVNLLDDHLVDLLLDAAEAGVNRVEREGLSVSHPSEFALIATMNPEEGALRPQLLDRFGFCVDIASEKEPEQRVLLLERRESFEADPAAFALAWQEEGRSLAARLESSKARLPHVTLPKHVRGYIGELCRSQRVAGHRADLVIARGAAAHAAWEGRTIASTEDVLAVSEFALVHRRRDPLPAPPPPPEPQEPSQEPPADPPASDPAKNPPTESRDSFDSSEANPPPQANQPPAPEAPNSSPEQSERVLSVGAPFRVKHLAPKEDRLARKGSGRRQHTRSADRRGRYVRSRPARNGQDLALDATLRAAAPHQLQRRESSALHLVVRREDWQAKVRERRTGALILFVVDASGSMAARGRMVASKGAILSLLLDAYQKRDRVGLVSFRRREAELLLPPTASIDVASRLLRELPVGGRTPLAAGLVKAHETLRPILAREPNLRPLAILVSDGRANAGLDGPGGLEEVCRLASRIAQEDRVRWVVVDTEDARGVRFGHVRKVAAALRAEVFAIEELHARDLVNLVKGQNA
jgi:magnesium chelatase subunit D